MIRSVGRSFLPSFHPPQAKEHIANYKRFHTYWKSKCDPLEERSGGSEACCITGTYEDLQDKGYLKTFFVTAVKQWLGIKTDSNGVVEAAVIKAIAMKPPKHAPPNTAHRFTADNYLQLI